MPKLLHTADLHLDSPLRSTAMHDALAGQKIGNASRGALRNIVAICEAEGVAGLLLSGDVFDKAHISAEAHGFFMGQMEQLRRCQTDVFIVRGNHDAQNRLLHASELPGHVTLFSGRTRSAPLKDTRVMIHGVSFDTPHIPHSLVPKMPRPETGAGAVNIAMLHSSLGGASGSDNYAPCTVADLEETGFDYWALGHIHKRQIHKTRPLIVMPGTPQGRDMGEDGPKSATLVTIDGTKISIEERRTCVLAFQRCECAVHHSETMDDVYAALQGALRKVAQSAPPFDIVLRPVLTGKTPLDWRIRRDAKALEAFCRNMPDGDGQISIERLAVHTRPPDAGDGSAGGDAFAEIFAQMARTASDPQFLDEAMQHCDALISALPPELQNDYGKTDAERRQYVAHLARQASAHAVALLRGETHETEEE